MTRLSLIALSSALAISAASAQQPASKPAMDPGMHMKMMMPMNSDSTATKGYKQSMITMMSGMPAYTGDADVDFMKQMKGHHQAAINMAKVEPATKGYKQSMITMMSGMPAYTGDADVDFMKQMKGHHQAAINMAKVELANGKDAEAKKLAQEIVTAQEKEIATIDAWLKTKGK